MEEFKALIKLVKHKHELDYLGLSKSLISKVIKSGDSTAGV
jgi:restriction endonuclease